MATFELSLSTGYVPDWGFTEGVREIYQNALDKQTTNPENVMFHELNEEAGTLLIGSKDSVLERKTLLLGQTSKAGDAATIGKFGEGYKLALLVLLRSRYNVKIYNYGAKELWEPCLRKSKQYGGETVLAIVITKYLFRRSLDYNLVFEISGVKSEDFNRLREYNLNISPPANVLKTDRGTVLKDESYKGKIFVKGLYVATVKAEKMRFGYDLPPAAIKLDRDRGMVENFNIFWETSRIWQVLPEEKELISEMLKHKNSDVEHLVYHNPVAEISQHAAREFREEYGSKAIPVTSQAGADRIRRLYPGHKPIFTSEAHAAVVRKALPEPKTAEKINKELSPQEHLDKLFKKVEKKLSQSERRAYHKIYALSKHWEWKN